MSNNLEQSVQAGISLGKLAFYFGCWNRVGHYLHSVEGKSFYSTNWPSEMPWSLELTDTGLLKNGKIKDIPDGTVYWTCGGKESFWYAFYWWDRSVDSRGGSNSGFYVRGFGYPEAQEAFDYACSQYPHIIT